MEPTVRAESYRVAVQVESGPEIASSLVHDREWTLHGLPAGKLLTICVSARNGTGETKPAGARFSFASPSAETSTSLPSRTRP